MVKDFVKKLGVNFVNIQVGGMGDHPKYGHGSIPMVGEHPQQDYSVQFGIRGFDPQPYIYNIYYNN